MDNAVVLPLPADVPGTFPTPVEVPSHPTRTARNPDLKGATGPVDRMRTTATHAARGSSAGDSRDRVETAETGPEMMATTAGGDE